MEEKKFGNWPEPESEKAPHRGQEIQAGAAKALTLVDQWIKYNKELDTLLADSIMKGNVEAQKTYSDLIVTAKKAIDEGLNIARGLGKEMDRDARVRILLNETIKKVKGKGENGQ